MVEIVFSGETKSALADNLGKAHYSYRFAEAKFESALSEEFTIKHAQYPYYFPNPDILRKELALTASDIVHVAFRSAENLRVIKGLYNICAFAWEFDVLEDVDWRGQNPFFRQTRILSRFDEIWATSNYTKSVLEDYGIANVHVIPAPIADVWREKRDYSVDDLEGIDFYRFCFNLAVREDIYKSKILSQKVAGIPDRVREAADAGKLYLFILNPYDLRKNMQHLVCAFEAFATTHPKACLLLKLVVPVSKEDPDFHVFWGLRRGIGSIASANSDNIFMIAGYLTDPQMAALQSVATFYTSPTVAEGQNLPLIEAMMASCIPVSTRNTAMLDYVNDGNSVIIETMRRSGSMLDLAPTSARRSFDVDMATGQQIYDALCASARLGDSQRQEMATKARQDALAVYDPAIIRARVKGRFRNIFATVGAAHDA